MNAVDYKEYSGWKKWSVESFASYDPADAAYFTGETKGISLNEKQILELGFGNGKFLGYARAQGARVSGTELIAEAVHVARVSGVRVYHPDLSDAIAEACGKVDLVAAFDVLEHLTLIEICDLFDKLALLVPPGGFVLARFPNGGSPLGCISQNGDHTHRSVLSVQLLMQLLIGKPWRLQRSGNPFRSSSSKNPLRRITLGLRHVLRDIIEFAFNRVYGVSVTLDPNVVVLIVRLPD
jgi:2-polyprenyl-3-methyl-5-hydroxy-6-metoxy-1,4-benzoquinol methylase